jgi:hypothetical protein
MQTGIQFEQLKLSGKDRTDGAACKIPRCEGLLYAGHDAARDFARPARCARQARRPAFTPYKASEVR